MVVESEWDWQNTKDVEEVVNEKDGKMLAEKLREENNLIVGGIFSNVDNAVLQYDPLVD